MTEYIEREEKTKPLYVDINAFLERENVNNTYGDYWKLKEKLQALPAADVEPVVRCGKCKYAEVGDDGFIETCNYWNDEFNTFHLTTMHPNGYCSNGIERMIPHMDERSEEE